MAHDYTTVIGLEIHVQLKTLSKMFCRCSNSGEDAPPNTTICPICVGHPGTLPVLNSAAVEYGIRTSLALHCEVPEVSKFDRKNYFYPDLPKGYQISQYDQPIGIGGYVDISPSRRIRIRRLHLEEDAAKLIHSNEKDISLVDFNRSSTPLMEIVTEPDLRSSAEAGVFLHELRLLVRHLDVSSADMEKGHLRCDANVSLEFDDHGIRVQTPISEIKNLNSFRSVERALGYESKRLYEEWMSGGDIKKRNYKITVGWNDAKGVTILQRWKEEAHDYRYFPEPDLPPTHTSQSTIDDARARLPELPQQKRLRFMEEYGLNASDVMIICEDNASAAFFEHAASELDEWIKSLSSSDAELSAKTYRLLASWYINKFSGLQADRITPENFGQLIALIAKNTINSTTAQELLQIMAHTGGDPAQIIKEQNLEQVSDTNILDTLCDAVIEKNPEPCENYRKGKTNAIMFLVGQVMKEMSGKAQPNIVREILEKKLSDKA
ncbi:Asp-tRNA(Asn)/Glu-tRNA(Gln) amidotransferase subunit GatB [Candidatus Uhrbacteria bacterium]|nr:Asp-tRNA(Asn)/Glu-tRNA(Gln) amidotransferase subunit GatB [Candidatus Uhrbacteria bacterium]